MQMEIDDLTFSLSFNCYFSDSLTSTTTATAAAKVSREFMQEQQAAQFHEFSDVDQEDFEFSLVLDDELQVSGKQISVQRLPKTASDVDFPVTGIDSASSVNIQIQKLFVNGGEASSFSPSSESSESDDRPSGSFCMWRPKADVVSSTLTKCKKSRSAGSGSGSRRWRRILDLLRRSNSGGKDSMFFLRSKKIKASKQNRKVSPVEVTGGVAGKLKAGSSPSFHELFYARKRAEKEGDKMKSFLPYRQDLLGFFVNINRIGNKKSTF
ncbi:hypothetical protein L6452_41663 [Arctium lappa]|uniref:Uncharacterized protein n=1 Tax=Arctium lappa TaxID=4217 RepID=A0ACB8XPI9_ARCLA|nr:hypothetical protein L6452_41663 [Arctium lappa]